MFFYELNVTFPQRTLRVPLQAETQEQAWHLSRDLFPDHDLKLVPQQRKSDPDFWAI